MFKSLKIKRIIPLNKISAVTISSYYLSFEFVVHVANEHDYRYDGRMDYGKGTIDDKRDKLIFAIARGMNYFNGSNLNLILREEAGLEEFTTQEKDLKEGKCRMPNDKPIQLNVDDLASGVGYVIKKSRISQQDFTQFDNLTQSVFGKKGSIQESTNNDTLTQELSGVSNDGFEHKVHSNFGNIPMTSSVMIPQ